MKLKSQTRVQQVMSEPSRKLLGSYETKSGQVKNRYITNPNAVVVKTIFHSK